MRFIHKYTTAFVAAILAGSLTAAEYGSGGQRTPDFSINTAPAETYAWGLATGQVFTVKWDYPVGVTPTASLQVEALGGFLANYTTTATHQVVALPADKENVYTLTLVLGGTVTKTAKIAVVAGCGTSSAKVACRFSEADAKPWNRLQRINVLPVLAGATSLVINDETLATWPNGAPCTWYGWGPASAAGVFHELTLNPFGSIILSRYPDQTLIQIR